MTIEEYAGQIAKECDGEVKQITKNGVSQTAILVKIENGMYAMHYIDDWYDNDVSVDKAIEAIQNCEYDDFSSYKDEVSSKLKDFESCKNDLVLRMFNEKNKDGFDLYRNAIDYGYDDFILVPALNLNDYVINLPKEIIDKWKITEDELFDVCVENTKKRMAIVDGQKIFGKEMPDTFIISNCENRFGAVSILFAHDFLKEQYPDGYVVIPSSVDEVFVMGAPQDVNALTKIIQLANQNIPKQDILGFKPYFVK